MRFAVIAAVIALFATSAIAGSMENNKARQCFPDYCSCNEDSCSGPACCDNGSCPC
ncbi:hypothetical protein C8F04DRAFT_1388433 [Mycena alexandri]|uniref:Uncharacterized protein n=1 Tax=Mycena alexandri TaxID=1745969 RepID=A0AAD6XFA0_9AGAR|nr:hypothetical protein C8F04DRAFT_1388433 [Mycena alexandri]